MRKPDASTCTVCRRRGAAAAKRILRMTGPGGDLNSGGISDEAHLDPGTLTSITVTESCRMRWAALLGYRIKGCGATFSNKSATFQQVPAIDNDLIPPVWISGLDERLQRRRTTGDLPAPPSCWMRGR